MRIAVLMAALVLATASMGSASAEPRCGMDAPCPVESGSYRVSPPAGWDGTTPLPTAFFFHGYGGSADGEMQDLSLRKAFSDAGILLVFANGANKDWSFPGSPAQRRDDFAYVDRVLADLRSRWPVDARRLWATGFSVGASMVWAEACYRGDRFRAYVAVSGAFWGDIPADCPTGPVDLLQIHGLTDNTVPLEGRAIRRVYHQSDVFASLARLREVDGCRSNPTGFATSGPLVCRSWTGCSSDRELELCLHAGGHMLPPGWFPLAWSWVQKVTTRSGS